MGCKPQLHRMLAFLAILWLVPAFAQTSVDQAIQRQFQSALTAYKIGKLDQATQELESLLPRAAKSFEVHELLGEIYAAQAMNDKAIDQLSTAVQLRPDSAPARTNLAAALFHAGKIDKAGEEFRRALALEPHDYDANHNLGEFYIQSKKIAEASPYLETAQRIRPSYENGYDLALSYLLTNKPEQARLTADSLTAMNNTAELHNLLGQIDEMAGKPLDAAREFEAAAHMDPREENIFDWGAELLLHAAYEPAVQVFRQGAHRYPQSQREAVGLGMALYWSSQYDEAVQALIAAVDLDPADARSYMFLFKIYDRSQQHAEDVLERFRRYAELQPGNALAQYDYAMSLWRTKVPGGGAPDTQKVEALLQKAAALDASLPDPHLQLGTLYFEEHDYDKSISACTRALELNPNLPDAHYRLGQDYVRTGQRDRAQQEMEIYQKQRAQHLAEADKQATEIQQFVYTAKGASSGTQ